MHSVAFEIKFYVFALVFCRGGAKDWEFIEVRHSDKACEFGSVPSLGRLSGPGYQHWI